MECVGPSSFSTSTLTSDSEDEFCINVSRKFGLYCLRGLTRLRSLLRTDRQEDEDEWGGQANFILISAKYFVTSYQWTTHYIREYFTSKDDYWRSVVLSITLFLVGVKLMTEFVPSKLPPVERN